MRGGGGCRARDWVRYDSKSVGRREQAWIVERTYNKRSHDDVISKGCPSGPADVHIITLDESCVS